MAAFWKYTLARLGLFVASYVVVWFLVGLWLEDNTVVNIWILLVSLVVSSILALLLLGGMRDELAGTIQKRAESINERIEESKRAEDLD